MSWEQLVTGIDLPFPDGLEIPELHPVEIDVPRPPAVGDIEPAAREAALRALGAVEPGATIAVGAGSRGLTGRVELVRGVVVAVRELGCEPFVVPAMGSHAGRRVHRRPARGSRPRCQSTS